MNVPCPLIPSEVDLREFPFMPLDVRRFRDSRLVAVRTPEEVLAAILLWSASWHQQPAASLPDDDVELSQLAGYGRAVKEFKRVREGALHGLVRCSDGRWYHPVVAEKAAEAWNGRLEMEWRRGADRVRKENKERAERNEDLLPIPPRPTLLSCQYHDGIPMYDYYDSAGIPSDDSRNSRLKRKGKGKGDSGKGKGIGESPDSPLRSESSGSEKRSDVVAAQPSPAKEGRTTEAWKAYSAAYHARYGAAPLRNSKVSGMLAKFMDRVPAEEAPLIAAFYVQSNRNLYVSSRHCVDLLLRDAEGLRTEWATGRSLTETESRQIDRTAATGNVFGKLIAEAEHGRQ